MKSPHRCPSPRRRGPLRFCLAVVVVAFFLASIIAPLLAGPAAGAGSLFLPAAGLAAGVLAQSGMSATGQ